ncbi:sodium:calcium antiporter [Henriciella barbarensis]|uniref:Sodium:calcium antiporter n=1 Tax=Henriciella barbarensis TaxID=86342 RepID=A0A399R4L3_9PROT|nr:calcium/sodium antiporter [Henriciella barbarensis]RIJ24359.1 sodium:calcium antiporter [Henriciella barbarensis]
MPDLTLLAALVGGLVILAVAGDFLVNGAVALARRIGVSPLVAGILIVGFGTSAPEMVVAVDASSQGQPGIAIGNIVGSNIANVWLVLAVPAFLIPLATRQFGLRRSYWIMIAVTALWIGWTAFMPLTPIFGFILLGSLIVYSILMLVWTSQGIRKGIDVGLEDEGESLSNAAMWVNLVIGLVGLPLGAHLIVEGGVGIARTYAVPEEVIGLTLLAIGTSLPELGAGIAAGLRRRGEVVIGNVIGSNIFNLAGSGAIIAFFGPTELAPTFLQFDHWALVSAAIVLGLFVLSRSRVTRLAALAMLLAYAAYIYGLVHGWDITGEVENWIGRS